MTSSENAGANFERWSGYAGAVVDIAIGDTHVTIDAQGAVTSEPSVPGIDGHRRASTGLSTSSRHTTPAKSWTMRPTASTRRTGRSRSVPRCADVPGRWSLALRDGTALLGARHELALLPEKLVVAGLPC